MESLHSNFSLFFTSIFSIPCWFLYITVNIFSLFPSTTACYSSKNYLCVLPDPSHFYNTGIGLSISLKSEVPTIVVHNCLKPRLLIYVRIFFLMDSSFIPESFQLQMVLSFPFLRVNDLRLSLLITRTRIFLLSCTQGVHTQGYIKCEFVLTFI